MTTATLQEKHLIGVAYLVLEVQSIIIMVRSIVA